jgi:hypothetical protein
MRPQTTIASKPGDNHTGILQRPDFAHEMLEGVAEFGPTSSGGAELIAQLRVKVAERSEPAATMPRAAGVDVERLPLIDKLGARLQFERTGVRLYQALLSKHDAYGGFRDGPSRRDLEQIRDQEHQHMVIAQQAIVALGGDPTVVTPCANLQATASRGVGDVLVDPRTTLIECLDAILMVELTDLASWQLLAQVAELAGVRQLGDRLREAERVESEHLDKVRTWITAGARLIAKPVD